MCLFIHDKIRFMLKNFFYNCMMVKYDRLERFHDRARDKLKKEFSMIRMLKLMRASRVLLNNSFLDKRLKYKIDHSYENVIDLDVNTSQAELSNV